MHAKKIYWILYPRAYAHGYYYAAPTELFSDLVEIHFKCVCPEAQRRSVCFQHFKDIGEVIKLFVAGPYLIAAFERDAFQLR